jgi:propanol-preferring alcohol dehydrogenase
MVFEGIGKPLRLVQRRVPTPKKGQILIRTSACAVCRTDLHVVDGELKGGILPVIPGHQVLGTVASRGEGSERFREGQVVGVPWLAWACLECSYCRSGRENLCEKARFHGHSVDGGYAEYLTADERFCFSMPTRLSVPEATPLLCAGLIGYRALRMTGGATKLGFFGFGASAHLLVQVARLEERQVYAFTRHGDTPGQESARKLGAVWAGASTESPPEPLDAAILFAPVGALVPTALRAVARGGIVVCAGIHMSDIPSFPYELLWEERSIQSVANLTRADGEAFLALAGRHDIRTTVEFFALEGANQALDAVRSGKVEGSAVLRLVEG